jgi:hypothetical protein
MPGKRDCLENGISFGRVGQLIGNGLVLSSGE